MKRLNVLFVMPVMGMGGSERLVHHLIRRLDRSHFSSRLAWLDDAEPLQEFRDLQVPLHCVPKLKRFDFSAMRKLSHIIQREKIDIVDAQHFMPFVYAYYGCRIVAKKPLIFTAHSMWEVNDTPWKWRVAGGYLLRRVGVSVGVTPNITSAIQTIFGIDASQTVTIENGVDTDVIARTGGVRGLKDGLGLRDGDVVIGIVANLKKVKNHLFLLQAFAGLTRECDNVKLLVIGQGFPGEPDNTEYELRSFVRNYALTEKVAFLGYRTNVGELLQVLDIFCLVSLREGLPLSLIEAMAASLPTIGTNVDGIRDAITPNKEGILVELGDVMGLKDALAHLVRDADWRRRLGHAGREKAMRRYSLQRCVREYEELFLSLANASRTR